MRVLEIKNLSKSFAKKEIIKKINLTIGEGEVLGFVGPNGAGKTTTLKLITNLIYPDSGEIKICEYDLLKEREKALSNIGAIIENPGLYTYLSGKDNLEYIRRIGHCTNDRMNFIIDYVGLADRINDTVKKYSLGMKQRLALGMCLLKQPKLLILDEPTNGLDPDGTISLRNMIQKLAEEQKVSIVFSSHLLSEVEKISDRIAFIKNGEIVSVRDKQTLSLSETYEINVDNGKLAIDVLAKTNIVLYSSLIDKHKITVNIRSSANIGYVLKAFVENNVNFSNVEKKKQDLEYEYMEIYKGGDK